MNKKRAYCFFLLESANNCKDSANQEIRKMLSEMTSRQRIFAMESIKMILDNKDNFK